jgi:hypothetical protein
MRGGTATRVTNVISGVSGITPLTPAMSAASTPTRCFHRLRKRSLQHLRGRHVAAADGGALATDTRNAAVLPPANRGPTPS